jgi:hypothetical protein
MNFLQRQLEDPIRLARLQRLFVLGLVVLAVAEIILPLTFLLLKRICDAFELTALAAAFEVHAPHFWFEWIPAWGSLYGLVSCAAIVVVSKWIGKAWLLRREDYYGMGKTGEPLTHNSARPGGGNN